MKRLIKTALTAMLSVTTLASCGTVAPALAAEYGAANVATYGATYATNYTFSSGADSGSTFGKATSYDESAIGDPLATNERRNKDAAFNAPVYGVFSGYFPTDPSSPYHDNTPGGAGSGYSGYGDYVEIRVGGANGGGSASYEQGVVADTSGGSSKLGISFPDAPGQGALPSTSTSAGYNTAPKYFNDGSIGTLHIVRINKTLKVYEGETLENMRKGIGHFESTSAWDGNAAFAGHNRGAAANFSFVKDLRIGDKITYTTPYGSRIYEVYRKDKISETDYSGLGWSVDNIISLITCVENQAELRWLVQAREAR